MPGLTGTTLGSYRILEPIGHGGMSMVYKAYHAGTDRLVAVKILPDALAQDPSLVERFHREARVIARLEHRHIVPIYDFGESAGIVYLAMRYLQAGTVKDVLASRKLTLADAMPLLAQVAGALDYAHQQGIVHRDVKPGNILVDKRGNAFLTDFGLAKMVEASGQLTNTGSLVGTPAYMAPEQTLGQPVSPATDVYALGVMVYEIATGRLPFMSDTPLALALMHLQATLPLPRTINPDLPEPVEQVILKALDKDPAQRYPTAGEFVAALSAAGAAVRPASTESAATAAGLALIAGEIAGQKPPEEVSSGLRTELHRQAAAEQRRRLMRWVPWGGAALAIIALLVGLFIFTNQTAQARVSGEQTATAIMGLVSQLAGAQTQVAAGGLAQLPTVQHLQTQLAAGLTAVPAVGRLVANTAAANTAAASLATATPSATPSETASPLPTPAPTDTPEILAPTPEVPLPTNVPLFAATLVPTSPPSDTPTDTSAPPTDTPAPLDTGTPSETLAPPTDTPTPPVPGDTPTDLPTETLAPPTDTPTDAPQPPVGTPSGPLNPPTDTPPPPTGTAEVPAF